MAFLEENCVLDILTDGILSECHPFVCGDDDMDEFFQKDALDYTRYRMGKSYCFRMKDDTQTIVACFTVSNDSIREIKGTGDSSFREINDLSLRFL